MKQSTPPKNQLRIHPGPAAKLSYAQSKFNRLLHELDALRERITKRTRTLEQALKDYAAVQAPAELEEDLARQRLILQLGALWGQPGFLKKAQRHKVRDLILSQADFLRPSSATSEDTPLAELLATLRAEWSRAQGIDDEDEKSMKALAEEMKDPAFFDPALFAHMDPTQFNDQMTPLEMMEEYKRQVSAVRERREHATASAPQTRRQTAAEKREVAMAEARERTLGTLYKQLAKVLHPDLERDPQRQVEKVQLMQQVTEAYRNNDIFTLLKLELEYLHRDEGDASRLTEEKVRIYVAVLAEQVELLRHECANLTIQPRFGPIHGYMLRDYPRLPKWNKLAQDSRHRALEMNETSRILSGPAAAAKKEMKTILEAFDEGDQFARLMDDLPGFFNE